MAVTVQGYNAYMQQQNLASAPISQAASIHNPRLDALIRPIKGYFDQLTPSQQDAVRAALSLAVKNDLIPGASSADQMYTDILTGMRQSNIGGMFSGSSPDSNATAAYNALSIVQDSIFNERGAYKYSSTSGLDANLVSQLSARVVSDWMYAQKGNALNKVDFGKDSITMQQAINQLIQQQSILQGSRTHNRLLDQQAQVAALEYEAASKFIFNTLAVDGRVGDTGVTLDKFKQMSIDEQKQFIDSILKRDSSGQFEFVDNDGKQYSHQAVVGSYVESAEVINAAKFGHKIFGQRITNEGKLRAKQLLQGQATEDFITGEGRKYISESIAEASQNIQFLAQTYGTNDLNTLQAIAEELNLGSISEKRNIKNVSEQLHNAINIAITTNKDIREVLQERADLIKALAPDMGGTEFVNGKFVTQVQLMRQANLYQQEEKYIANKSDTEIVAAANRSYQNTVNQFGGVAAAKYMLDNYKDSLPQEYKDRLNNLISQFEQAMANNDRGLAANISAQLHNETNLSYAEFRQAAAKYIPDINTLSVQQGLREQGEYKVKQLVKLNRLDLLSKDYSGPINDPADRYKKYIEAQGAILDIAGTTDLHQFMPQLENDIKLYNQATTDQERQDAENNIKKQLTEKFYSDKHQEQYLNIIRIFSEYGIDANKASNYIKRFVSSTDTKVVGTQMERDNIRQVYEDVVSGKDYASANLSSDFLSQIIAGLYGDGDKDLSDKATLHYEYAQYVKDKGLKVDTQEDKTKAVLKFLSDTSDDNLFALIGEIDKKGNAVGISNEELAARLEKSDLTKLGLDDNELQRIKQGVIRGGARWLINNSTEFGLYTESIDGQLFLYNKSNLAEKRTRLNKRLETVRKIDFEDFVKQKVDENNKEIEAKGIISEKEFESILKIVHEGKNVGSFLDQNNKFIKGHIFEGMTQSEALAYLNTKDVQGLTIAEQLHQYNSELNKGEQTPIVDKLTDIANNSSDISVMLRKMVDNDAQKQTEGTNPKEKEQKGTRT